MVCTMLVASVIGHSLQAGQGSGEVHRTPLPYSKMSVNTRTPGQILSLKSNLGFVSSATWSLYYILYKAKESNILSLFMNLYNPQSLAQCEKSF